MRGTLIWTWLIAWGPPLAWGTLIWQLGSDGFSEPETRSFLGPLIAQLLPFLTAENIESLGWFVRKAAHPSVYGLLALLCWRGVELTLRTGQTGRRVWVLAPVVGLALADESRQAFSAVRSGSGVDVLLDLAGGLVAFLLLEKLTACREQPLFGDRPSTPPPPSRSSV